MVLKALFISLVANLVILGAVAQLFAQGQIEVRQLPLPKHPADLKLIENKVDSEDGLPSITYGSARRGAEWVETGRGARVCVDDGIEYDGVKYYLSLSGDLLAVDQESSKTIWSNRSSAFWNHLAIEKIETKTDEQAEERSVVALRNKRDDRYREFVQHFDLKTGEELKTEKTESLGIQLELKKTWTGNDSGFEKRVFEVLETEEAWLEFLSENLEDCKADLPEKAFDSANEMIVVIAYGEVTNCRGISITEAYENDERILIRLFNHSYQTVGGAAPEYPYGVFVLPKRQGKKYVFETNRQSYIGGPAIWKTYKEFEN